MMLLKASGYIFLVFFQVSSITILKYVIVKNFYIYQVSFVIKRALKSFALIKLNNNTFCYFNIR